MVVTMWDSRAEILMHDGIYNEAGRTSRLNANAVPIYARKRGEPTTRFDARSWLTQTASQIKHYVPNPKTHLPDVPMQPFGLLGQEPIMGRPHRASQR